MFHLLYLLVSSIFHTRLHRVHHAAFYSFLDNFIVIFLAQKRSWKQGGVPVAMADCQGSNPNRVACHATTTEA